MPRLRLAAVFLSGAGASWPVSPAKRRIWKVSSGPMPSSAFCTAATEVASGSPCIEPEVSSANTSSRGRALSCEKPCGGSIARVK